MSRQGGNGAGRPLTVPSVIRALVVSTLAPVVSSALCPTPDSRPLSSVVLLGPGNGERLAWTAAPRDTVARYQCDPGYLARGNTERRCHTDGSWTGAAPYCYLNAATQTDLMLWPEVVDGNLSTHIELSQLNGVDVGFYDLSPEGRGLLPIVHEIRLVTSGQQNLAEWRIDITKSSLGDPCDGKDRYPVRTEIKQTRLTRNAFGGDSLWTHTFPTETCFKSILIRKTANTIKKDPSLPAPLLYEVQLVTENAGVSRPRCRLPAGLAAGLVTSWAAGQLCYHLMGDRKTHVAASRRCRQLGDSGQLLQLSSAGLRDFTANVLRQQSAGWFNEFIWTAGGGGTGREPAPPGDSEVSSEANVTETARKPSKDLCHGVRQIKRWRLSSASCDEERMFVCQTKPSECGSPAVAPGQRFDPPPGPILLAANVTCAGHRTAGGTVFCRDGRWTTPTFCDNDGVLGVALGAVAGILLLFGCVLAAAVSYLRWQKRGDEGGWETYTYIRRLSRLSRYGGRQPRLAANLMAETTYSEPLTRTGPRHPRSSWLHGEPPARRGDSELPPPPPPSTSPPSSAGLTDPSHLQRPPAAEYSEPLVQGRRHSPKLSLAERPTGGGGVATGGEYAVPYDAMRRQERSESRGVPPDVVTSTGTV